MNKTIVSSILLVGLFTLGVVKVGAQRVPATVVPSGKSVVIPSHAVEVTPGVFALGESIDPQTGEVVTGYAFVHGKKNEARSNSAKPAKGTTCYTYLASGAKWKTNEPWIMNPNNDEGLDTQAIFALMSGVVAKWEDATDGTVGVGTGVNVMGEGSLTGDELSVDNQSPDGKNETYFGSVADANAIAVTTVWGVFGGPPQQRYLSEWDMIFDQSDFGWATDGSLTKMDFDSLATHELGHAFGLGDLYTTSCNQETMYGYASEGEINKRSLNSGDILGINNLY